MKKTSVSTQPLRVLRGLALTLAVITLATAAQGASQYANGTFNWDNGITAAWGAATGGPYSSVWTSGNDAVLEGTAGTVTLSSPTVQNLTFNTTGYILSGGSTLTLGGTTPMLFLGSGISGTIGNNTAAVLGGSVGLTKSGVGTLTLNGSAANTFTGGLTLNAGTLTGDFSNLATPTDLFNNGNALTLYGSTLTLRGKTNTATSQSFASTTVNSGGTVVTLAQNGATSLTAALGAITRNTGGTLNFSVLPNATNVVTTTTANGASGILGRWASVGLTNTLQYAANNGSGIITNYTGATITGQPANLSDVNNAAVNYAYGATPSPTLTGAITANTLRFTGATAGILTNGGNSITLNGLMNAGGAALTISGTGNLTIGANQELVILGNDRATTLNPRIVDNGAGASSLVYHGAGSTLTLGNGTNTYSGGTVINSGTLTMTAFQGATTDIPLGAGPVTVNPGGTLGLNRNYLANNLTLNNATLTSGNSFASTLPASSTITLNGISTFSVSGSLNLIASLTGPGGLIKANTTINLPVTGYNTYNGPTTISTGGLQFQPQALYGGDPSKWVPTNITVASGAVLGVFFGGVSAFIDTDINTLFGNLTTGLFNNGLRAGSAIGFNTANGSATYSYNITDSTGTGGGAIGLMKIGANTLELSGSNTFSGPVAIGPTGTPGGTLRVYSFNYITSGTLSPNTSSSLGHPTTMANGTIACGNSGNNQSVGLTYLGTGETTDRILSMNAGVSSATALTLDQSGTGLLKFASPLTTPSGANRILVLQGSTAGTGEFAGAITNASATAWTGVTKSGTGTWTLSGANNYQPIAAAGGLTTIAGGCLVLGSANAVPGGIGVSGGLSPLTFGSTANNGGVLGLGYTNFYRSLAAAGTASAATFTGNGGWAAYGTNRSVNLGGASATITWATAGTGFNGKTLILGNATATHTLDFQNPIDLGTANRIVQVDDGAATIDAKFSGNITGSTGGTLTKNGNGTLALTGINNYTDNTTVNAGGLLINGTNSGPGVITVNAGATNGGTGTVSGAVTYNAGAYALFTVTPDSISSATNLTPMTISGQMSFDGTEVHLNAPTNLPSGTYTLATSSATPVEINPLVATPVLDSGSYAPGFTSAVVSLDTVNNLLLLTVNGLPTNSTKLAIISVNGGTNPTAQVSFPVVVQAQDDNGAPRVVLTDTAVSLSKKIGSYLLFGTLTGTIPAGSSSVTISGVKYANADNGVVITATRTSGDSLSAGDSAPFNVLASTAPSYLAVTSFPSPQTAGVAGSVTVTCKTLSGTTATSYAGTVHLSSTAVSAGLPADYTFVPATDKGVHTFSGVTLNTAGTQTITATDTVTPSITGSQTNIVINPAAASALAVSGFPTPQTTNVAGSVTVTAKDAYANTATSYTGTIHFTSSDSLAVLPGNYTFVTGDAGSHIFANGVTFRTLGTGQWIAAADTLTPSITGTQANITIWIFPIAFTWTNGAGNWSAAANWTNDQGVVFAPLAAGELDYSLSFGAGTYTATHDLNDGFLLNQLNFAGAATLNYPAGSPRGLTFTNKGATLPQINQNSNTAALVLNPIKLGANVTLGVSGSGGVSLYGLISGTGALIKTNSGTLTIGIANNTYSGGTMVNDGTVACTGPLSNPLGSGLATFNSGTRFDFNASTCANPFALYGGTLANGNGFVANVNGPVYLGANSTVDLSTTGNMKIAGNMSGPGGLIKIGTGGGPLILTGTNTYKGTNFINAGSVRFDSTDAVGSAALSISGGKANLNYSGDRVIPALILSGVAQALGTYGSSSSPAPVPDDVNFSGAGTVTVALPLPPPVLDPSTGYSIVLGNPTFTFTTVPGAYYRMLYSADVAVPLTTPWTPVVNIGGTPPPATDANGWVQATSGSMSLVDPSGTTAATQRFYVIEGSYTPTP